MSKTISATKSGTHTVADGKKVKARATIGDGQKGGWVMLVDDKHVAGGTGATWVQLGDGADLRTSHLEVSAVMTDVQAASNKLTLTVEVVGKATTTLAITNTGDDGDKASYSIVVFFA